MIKKIEGYECDLCEAVIVGTRKDAQQHRAVPFDKPFPRGLVFAHRRALVDKIDSNFYFVSNCSFDLRRDAAIRSDFDNPFFHGHQLELTKLTLGEENFYFDGHYSLNSKLTRDRFKRRMYRFLNDEEVHEFARLYASCDYRSVVGFSSPQELVYTFDLNK